MGEKFRDVLCAAYPLFAALFVISIVLLVLLVMVLLFIEPGTGAYVTSLLSGSILIITLIGSAIVIRFCR